MSLAVIVGLVRCIDIPFDVCEGVGGKGEFEAACGKQVTKDTFEFSPVIFIRGFDTCGEESDGCLDIPSDP